MRQKYELICILTSTNISKENNGAESFNLNDKADRLRFILGGMVRDYEIDIDFDIPTDCGIQLVADSEYRGEPREYIPPYTLYHDDRIYYDIPCFPLLESDWMHTDGRREYGLIW